MKIGYDIDGVLAGFHSAFITLIRDVTGVELPPRSDIYPNLWNFHMERLTKEQDEAVMKTIARSDSFWKSLTVENLDARKAIGRLSDLEEDGHDVYFLTSRGPGKRLMRQTQLWLHRQGIQFPNVLLLEGPPEKAAAAKALALDSYVDDSVPNALAVRGALPATSRVYLIDKPWNQEPEPKGVLRVKTLEEMMRAEGGRVGRAA